jgi:hypothetical protein
LYYYPSFALLLSIDSPPLADRPIADARGANNTFVDGIGEWEDEATMSCAGGSMSTNAPTPSLDPVNNGLHRSFSFRDRTARDYFSTESVIDA